MRRRRLDGRTVKDRLENTRQCGRRTISDNSFVEEEEGEEVGGGVGSGQEVFS